MKRQLPKNVRQIGNVSDNSKIYVEDYVDTFFDQLCDKAGEEMQGAFLIGEMQQDEGQDYIYVYGAVQMQELTMKGKDFLIEDSVWKHACETCKEFFGDAEILGWYIAGGENNIEINHNIKKLHQKFFRRENSLFVTKNAREKEEKFYIYRFRDLMECGGHYIYYEKNLEMQNYMIACRKKIGFTPGEIIEDRVTKSFRNLVMEKAERNEKRSRSRFVYVMSTFLVLVVLVIGITMINNYDKMQSVQNTLDRLTQNVEEQEKIIETSGEIVTPPQEKQPEEIKPEEVEPEETKPEEVKPEGTNSKDVTPEDVNSEGTKPEENKEEPIVSSKKTYIVKKGDTLETISKKEYGDVKHIKAICELNQLQDGNLIMIGQKLLLP